MILIKSNGKPYPTETRLAAANHPSTAGQPQSASPFGGSLPQQTATNPFQPPNVAPIHRNSVAQNRQVHRRDPAQQGVMQQQAMVRNTPSGTNDSDLANILCRLIPALQTSSASASQSNASIKMWRIMLAQSPTGSIATDQPTFFAPQPSHLFIDSIIKATNGKAASLPITTARLQASWMNALYNSPNVDITAACSEDPLLCTSTVVRLANFHFLSESYSTASTDYKHWLSLLSFAPVKTTTTK